MANLPTNFPRNICAYCGSDQVQDFDHVPPQTLFPHPRPSNLITVPICSKCHSDTSKDDEYFRLKISLRDDVGNHPKARANWDSIFRSLQRDEAKGLKESFLSDIHSVRLRTQAGLYLGRAEAYNVDMERIQRVVERIVRGLYFAEMGHPLGLENEVNVHTEEGLMHQPPDSLAILERTILVPLASVGAKLVGDGVFAYWFKTTEEQPEASVWVFNFYEKLRFLCFTGS